MSLRAALLALVSAGPLTGYDAAKHFRSSVGHLWHAPDSQIYPELRRMEADGLLDAVQVPWGSKSATKTQYSLTDAGREALAQWQRTAVAYAPERDHAHLVAAYFEWGTPDTARERLREHIDFYSSVLESARAQVDDILARTSPTLQRRFASTQPSEWDRIAAFKVFAYQGKISRAQAEISWAQDGLDLLDRLDAPGSAEPSARP